MRIIKKKMKIRSYSTRDYAYEELREQIVMLELEPGCKVSENEISTLLGISRTPVREAFVKLGQEKLLEVYPQKGTFVSLIDLNFVEEARFIREHLERAIVREACKDFSTEVMIYLEENIKKQENAIVENDHQKLYELDELFHQAISRGAGKERIWSVIQQEKAHLNRIRVLSLSANIDWGVILTQHREIISAIQEQNEDEADELMRMHLTKLRMDQKELTQKFPDYFEAIEASAFKK